MGLYEYDQRVCGVTAIISDLFRDLAFINLLTVSDPVLSGDVTAPILTIGLALAFMLTRR